MQPIKPLAGWYARCTDEQREDFEERAAICEYQADMPRDTAERYAAHCVHESAGPVPPVAKPGVQEVLF